MLDRAVPEETTRLSPRELEVLGRTTRGMTNPQIAAELGLTVHAIKFHLASIFRKLGVTNRTEAAVVYLQSQNGQPFHGGAES